MLVDLELSKQGHQQDLSWHERNGRLLAWLMWIILLTGAGFTIYSTQRWWLPPLASSTGAGVDLLFTIMFIVMGVVFVGVHAMLAVFLTRFSRRDHKRAFYWHENSKLELYWTVVPAVILVVLTMAGGLIWASISGPAPGSDDEVVTIEVWGVQFGWIAHYPGEDGRLGRTDVTFMDRDNPAGIDPDDPAGSDDIYSNGEIVLPVGKQVQVQLRSRDVIHSFFLPHFRVKQDTVPGRVTTTWFETTEPGVYEIACAELCGVGHYLMAGTLRVVSEDEYQAWLRERAQERDGAAAQEVNN